MPADGTGAANWTERRPRYVVTFSAARTKSLTCLYSLGGVANAKNKVVKANIGFTQSESPSSRVTR